MNLKSIRISIKTGLQASLAVSALLLVGCEIVDDQRIVAAQDQALANPTVALNANQIAEHNSKHKVIMAVIDSGVDYLHPKLSPNMHYQVDAASGKVKLGRDFTAEDDLPSPYVVRTSLYNPEVPEDERGEAKKKAASVAAVLAAIPGFADFLHPNRNTMQEIMSGSYHGTHVAGLMAYDRPDFGVIPYRVLPHNMSQDPNHDYLVGFRERLIAAIDQSAKDGAQVVNISLGVKFQKPHSNLDSAEEARKNFEIQKKLFNELTDVVKKHPQVLFVVAAGNDGSWVDARSRYSYPCGLPSSNVLCVGALDENDDPAAFTNIPLHGVDFVMALGADVYSTMPMQFCNDQSLLLAEAVSLDSSGRVPADELKGLQETLESCKKTRGMGRLSGTSMASPLVAHLAAEILAEKGAMSGADLVKEIKGQAVAGSIGNLPVLKLKIKKPSWYSDLKIRDGQGADSGYWEAIAPQSR